MAYEDDERSAAVQELVQGTLTFPMTGLGTRDLGESYAEVIELVHSALIYDPDTVFYLLYLASRRLRAAVAAEIALCTSLMAAVDDLSMPNRPVEDVSALVSARQSVLALGGALSRRGRVGGPEYERYRGALSRVRKQLQRVVRADYVPRGATSSVRDVVRPWAEARLASSNGFAALVEQHSTVLQQIDWFLVAFQEFQDAGVASSATSRQLVRASAQLNDVYETLEPLSPFERTAVARDALLRVLSNETVVKMLATGMRPGDYRISQSPSAAPMYRMSAYGTGTPASVIGSTCAPYPLYDSGAVAPTNILSFSSLNGSVVVVDLTPAGLSTVPGIQAAELIGCAEGPFHIGIDLDTPPPMLSAKGPYDTRPPLLGGNGGMFHVMVDGEVYEFPLPSNIALTAAATAAALDAAGAPWFKFSDGTATKPPLTFTAPGGTNVLVEYTNATPPQRYRDRCIEITPGFQYCMGLFPWTGGTVPPRSSGWDDNTKLWIKPNDMPTYVEVPLTVGDARTAANIVADIDAAAAIAVEDFEGDTDGNRVVVRSTIEGEGSIVTILSGGLYVAGVKIGLCTPSHLGALTLGLIPSMEDREVDVDIRALMNVLNMDAAFNVEAIATNERNEYLESRRATRTGASSLAIDIATDPTALWPAYTEIKLEIRNGDNRGVYGLTAAPVHAVGVLTFALDRRLRDTTAGLQHIIMVYRERLRVTSLDTSLASEIQCDDPANTARLIFGFDLLVHVGDAGYVLVERDDPVYGWIAQNLQARFIRVGDTIYNGTGTYQTTVSGIGELSDGVIEVSPNVVPSFSLTVAGFSVRSLPQDQYETILAGVETWLDVTLSPYEEGLPSIDRALAPLLLSTPSRSRVDSAYNLVSGLSTRLTALQTTLDAVSMAAVKAATVALSTLLEQGFDRARRLLLDGRYSEFFALTASDASFSRRFQTAVNEVIVSDANVSSYATSRGSSDATRLVSSWSSEIDPQYDFSDMEAELPASPVVDYYPGSRGGEEI